MNHNDHVELLKPANLQPGGSWADLGAGSGAFTLALRELIGPEAQIHAVDKDLKRLSGLEKTHRLRFNHAENLHLVRADFSQPLELPPLDGAVMANSLHFFKEKEKVLRHVRTFLKPKGILLVVEYNVDKGNPWVPHPVSFKSFRAMAPRAGFSEPQLLRKVPSSFLREFYSAAAYRREN